MRINMGHVYNLQGVKALNAQKRDLFKENSNNALLVQFYEKLIFSKAYGIWIVFYDENTVEKLTYGIWIMFYDENTIEKLISIHM